MPHATLTLIQMLPLRNGEEEVAVGRDHNLNAPRRQRPQISHSALSSLSISVLSDHSEQEDVICKFSS